MLAEQIQISENQQNKTKPNKPHRIESTNEPIEKETTIFQDKFQALIVCFSDHSAAKKRFTIDRKCREKKHYHSCSQSGLITKSTSSMFNSTTLKIIPKIGILIAKNTN